MLPGTFADGFMAVWHTITSSHTAGVIVGILTVFGVVIFAGGIMYLASTLFTLLRKVGKDG